MDKIKKHKDLCNKIHKTYVDKNHDYGDSFGKSFKEFGPIAGIVRMEDKMNRIKSLVKKGGDNKIVDESMKDMLLDLSNYSLMLVMELGGETEEKDHFSDFKIIIKQEFMKFLMEYKYPDGISDVGFIYEPDFTQVTWIVIKDCSAMYTKLPSIDYLYTLGADERKKQYELAVKRIDPC